MKILFFGDIIGKNGRLAVKKVLPQLRSELAPDMIIANGENAAGGIGLTPETADELLAMGVDVITGGNHIFAHKEMTEAFKDSHLPVVRPLNYPLCTVGQGYWIKKNVAVVNIMGRVFINGSFDCPFQTMDKFLAEHGAELPKIIFVDLHAEATSEKRALGYYLDGRVSAVIGTHTHVPTADEQILPRGTAYMSDAGMTGARYSVIGDEPQEVIERFLSGIHTRLNVAKDKHQVVGAVLIDIDEESGAALSIQRIAREVTL